MATEKFEYPGKLDITSIVIKSTNGNELDITDQIFEINIFESMFNTTLSASIIVMDSSGAISRLPIIGQEQITFTMKTPTQESKSLVFYVYKITSRYFTSSRANGYVLNLVSNEAMVDQNTSFSKSYSGTHSDIVKKIFRDAFTGTTKILELDNSESSTRFILPYWNPFQAITWLANRTFGSGGIPSYMFFETLDGFKFKNIFSLMKGEAKSDYIHRPTKIPFSKNAVAEKLKTIVDMNIIEMGSTMEYVMNGAFGARVITKDINENSLFVKDYEYSKTFKPILNETLLKANIDAFGQSLENPNNTRFIGTTSNTYKGLNDNNEFGRWVLERKALIEILCATNIEILVYGNSSLTTGDTINLLVPEASSTDRMDEHLSGKYLVTGVRHIINPKVKHMMALSITKDSYASKKHLEDIQKRVINVESSRSTK